MNGHSAVVEQLVAAGAEVNWQEEDGATALMAAAGEGHSAIVEQLVAAGAEVNRALIWAAGEGHSAVVEQLVAAGAEVNWREEEGETALMAAVGGCFSPRSRRHMAAALETVQRLLAAGAEVNCQRPRAVRRR